MKIKLSHLKLLVLVSFFSLNLNAEVVLDKLDEYDKFHRQYAKLYVTDSIEKEDVKAFQDALKKVKDEGLHIKHDSVILYNNKGGYVLPAREIGKLVRNNKLSTWVPRNSFCRSACVEILVAGICRMALGDVEVHRAFSSYEFKREVNDNEIERSRKDERKYFLEMDMPPTFIPNTEEIPHWTIKRLTHDEKLLYGLYSTVEYYELNRMEEVAMYTSKSKKELMEILHQRYIELNYTKPTNMIKEFLSEKFGIEFKKEDPKYPRCSEQLFLTDSN